MVMGTGTCTGSGVMLMGSVGISAPDKNGVLQSVQAAVVPSVFGNAECLCNTMDLNMEIFLTAALPIGTLGTAEVWVGEGCDVYQQRSLQNQTACEKIGTIDISQFTLGSTTGSNRIEIPIDAAAVFSPNAHVCTTALVSTTVWVFLYSDPSNPFATCKLPLNAANAGPGAPTSPGAASGDGAVTVTWSPPTSTEVQPFFFQILCAQVPPSDGGTTGTATVVPGKAQDPVYSTCLPGNMMRRRALPTGGSLGTVVSEDGGTTLDAGSLGPDNYSLHTEATGVDGGTDDAAVPVDGGAVAGTTPTMPLDPNGNPLPAPFTNLDPAFVCSPSIPVGGTSYSTRIDGLANGQTYQFVVLSIDNYGNATPSQVITATPQPVEDLYRRYYDAGGRAHGFCFIATAAYGSYEHRYVRILREFRDRVLLPTRAGAAFVDWYYAHSPRAADYIAAHPTARLATQVALWPVIGGAALWLRMAAWEKALGLTLLVAAWLLARRRKATA
jgi:hypothetical protein